MAGFANIGKIPELKKRLIFTVLMLGVYRIGTHVPTPGVDTTAMLEYFKSQSGTLFGLFDLFAGGALRQFSIFSLGIMPYISASIILQLLTVVFPYLDRLQKEGELGRKKITQYTRYGTVLLSIIQGFGLATMFSSRGMTGTSLVINPGWGFTVTAVITLTAGTAFIMWLGEQINERGVGNGISLIIFAGIVANFPSAVATTFEKMSSGDLKPMFVLLLVAFMVFIVGVIIFFERGQRRIPVQYAKRVVGRKVYQGQSTYLPLRVNMSGVIPPIFASSLLVFPSTVSTFFLSPNASAAVQGFMNPQGVFYNFVYVLLIIFFCYFYTAVQFNPDDVAENMKKYGGYVPGIRPGKNTAVYIERVLERITLVGAFYISAICVLPVILLTQADVSFYFGGTSLLIVVGVALDTVAQIESHLLSRNYEGLMGPRSSKFRGRKG